MDLEALECLSRQGPATFESGYQTLALWSLHGTRLSRASNWGCSRGGATSAQTLEGLGDLVTGDWAFVCVQLWSNLCAVDNGNYVRDQSGSVCWSGILPCEAYSATTYVQAGSDPGLDILENWTACNLSGFLSDSTSTTQPQSLLARVNHGQDNPSFLSSVCSVSSCVQ
ncbi:hypothetical protein B0H65DRAFT_443741 [Neurospora tetraspora]|uniref:Uncharacterized protein n=1 Tax=Neurospora tetraspora TaxID=94610 RepID=A0AAE0JDP7_9PEZI|nr:hypothetical protein B0H65DRAFT_443741 [Neurospora tetraspora]